MKKGQGLSMNTIIIAAIVIIVLIVLILIFTGRIQIFSETVNSCTKRGGECKDKCIAGEYSGGNADCGEAFDCCVPLYDIDGSECIAKWDECSTTKPTSPDPSAKFSPKGRIDCPIGELCWDEYY